MLLITGVVMAVKDPECPICGDTFKDGRGLSGHLQFKHQLSGDEHREKLDEGMDRGQKRQTPAPEEVGGRSGRSVRDRELELKGMLLECREKQEEIREKDRSADFLGLPIRTDVEAKERLEELKQREQEILDELERIKE